MSAPSSTAATVIGAAAAFAQARGNGLVVQIAFGYTDAGSGVLQVTTTMQLSFASTGGAVTPSWTAVRIAPNVAPLELSPIDISSLSWADPAAFAADGVPALTTNLPSGWEVRDVHLVSAFNEALTLL
jgi:hypothetical protein